MRREEQERLAEKCLETALKNHSAEPRPGLETRILANLRAEKESSIRFGIARLWQSLAVAAVVTLLALGLVFWRREQRNVAWQKAGTGETPKVAPERVERSVKQQSQDAKDVQGRIHGRRHAQVNVHAKKGLERPRREQFPSPVPLTPDERALLAYLRTTPGSEVVHVARVQKEQLERAEAESRKIFVEGMK